MTIADDIQFHIDCAENGISRVPRGVLVEWLNALTTAPSVTAEVVAWRVGGCVFYEKENAENYSKYWDVPVYALGVITDQPVETVAMRGEEIQSLLSEPFELNLSNYNQDDVATLNDWAIRAHDALAKRSGTGGDAKKFSGKHSEENYPQTLRIVATNYDGFRTGDMLREIAEYLEAKS